MNTTSILPKYIQLSKDNHIEEQLQLLKEGFHYNLHSNEALFKYDESEFPIILSVKDNTLSRMHFKPEGSILDIPTFLQIKRFIDKAPL